MNRRDFLAAAGAGLFAAPRRPNIVFIILDDLGYGDLGCYGQQHTQTPNIDGIAREAMRFTDCYAGAAVCAPSRAVLMTGLHVGHAPVRSNAGTIPILPEDITVAEVLKEAGYATGGFGKWGLGDARTSGAPTRQGFDEFFGYLHQTHAHSYFPDFLWLNDQKFPLPGNRDGKGTQYSADLIAERSFEFLRRHKDRPFFLYACYTLPHARFEIPDVEPYQDQPWPRGHKTYAAMITRADRYVGRIVSMLREFGLERDTAVFVTSDNGAHEGEEKGFQFFKSNGALRGQKGQLYEGGIRVPMMVRWPGRVRAGATSTHPWAFCDVMPTLAEIAGAKAPRGIDGISVVPALAGGHQPQHEFLYWEHMGFDFNSGKLRQDNMIQAVRMGDWKAVRRKPRAPLELYNLREDPGETADVAGRNPAVVEKIEAYLKTARTEPRPHNTGSREWVS